MDYIPEILDEANNKADNGASVRTSLGSSTNRCLLLPGGRRDLENGKVFSRNAHEFVEIVEAAGSMQEVWRVAFLGLPPTQTCQ